MILVKALLLVALPVFMAGTVREGERIPRRELPEFNEATSFSEAVTRDGIMGTAFADKNQYGPVGMMIMLFVVAGITSAVLAIL